MSQIPHSILKFVGKHHLMTLATTGEAGPHCCHVFYAYDKRANLFIFTSNPDTLHAAQALADPSAAAGIALETRNVGKVRGLQLEGEVRSVEGELRKQVRKVYVRKFPFTAASDLKLWVFAPRAMKYTDNTLGFGSKILWP